MGRKSGSKMSSKQCGFVEQRRPCPEAYTTMDLVPLYNQLIHSSLEILLFGSRIQMPMPFALLCILLEER